MALYMHEAHPHTPRDVNAAHRDEQQSGGFNTRLAVHITVAVSTMWCAYAFVALAVLGFPGLGATAPQYVQWISQTFLQLVFLPVLAVGTAVLARKQELMADEQYRTTVRMYHDVEQLRRHLDAQDQVLQQLVAAAPPPVAAATAVPAPPKRSHHKKANEVMHASQTAK